MQELGEAKTSSDHWPEKYRPASFGQVVGQTDAIQGLRRLLVARGARNVIIEGPSGAGKTTLARIFAAAIACANRRADDSPCLACEACRSIAEGRRGNFHLIRCSKQNVRLELECLIENVLVGGSVMGTQVVFLDEAQELPPKARQALLLELEKQYDDVVYLFALPDASALTFPVQSRCRIVRVSAPNREEATACLRAVIEAEGLNVKADALAVIVAASRSFRELVRNLQAVAESVPGAVITAELARSALLSDRTERAIACLELLLAGDRSGALTSILTSRLTPEDAVGAIQRLLLHLKLNFMRPLGRVGSETEEVLFSSERCQAIINELVAQARFHGVPIEVFFDEILEFWQFMPLQATDLTLQIHIARFFDVLSMPRNADSAMLPIRPDRAERAAAQKHRSTRALRPSPAWRSKATESEYLSYAQVLETYEAASYLSQRFGLTFDTLVRLRHEPRTAKSASSGEILRRLRQRIEAWTGRDSSLHQISLSTMDGDTPVSTVVLHAGDLAVRVHGWLRNELEHIAGEIQIPEVVAATMDGRLKRQWQLMRQLWGYADPEVRIGGKRLLDLLEVPVSLRRSAGPVNGRRFSTSQSIGVRSRQTDPLGSLSAMADGAWDRLFDYWERDEFESRSAHEQKRAHIDRRLKRRLAEEGTPLLRRPYLSAYPNEISSDIYVNTSRERRWRTWW